MAFSGHYFFKTMDYWRIKFEEIQNTAILMSSMLTYVYLYAPSQDGSLWLMEDLPMAGNAEPRIVSESEDHFLPLVSPSHSICSEVPLMVQFQQFQGELNLGISPLHL